MKYCMHCGKELADEAVFCAGCGCALESKKQFFLKGVKKFSRKQIITSVIAIVILVCVVIGAVLFVNKQKESKKYEAIYEALEGETYDYIGYSVWYSLTFKENKKCERYIGSSTGLENTSLFDYSIKFTDDKVYILLLKKDGVATAYEAQIGYGNKILALIDEDTGYRYD